ncbi:MAG: hypothetical protein LBS53_10820 [Synergistaceae bacterium]|nr:hypothetical protein [Synergistaceae bacterium]
MFSKYVGKIVSMAIAGVIISIARGIPNGRAYATGALSYSESIKRRPGTDKASGSAGDL